MAIYLGSRLLGPSSGLPGSRSRAGPTHGNGRRNESNRRIHCSLLDLAPDGVCLARLVTQPAGELLPHRFTLTARARGPRGGLLSVALSLASRPVGVTHHRVLRSPDFPPAGPFPGPIWQPERPDRRPSGPLRGRSGPVSRVLYLSDKGRTGDGHLSRKPIARPLKRSTRKSIAGRTDPRERPAERIQPAYPLLPARPCSRWGLPSQAGHPTCW